MRLKFATDLIIDCVKMRRTVGSCFRVSDASDYQNTSISGHPAQAFNFRNVELNPFVHHLMIETARSYNTNDLLNNLTVISLLVASCYERRKILYSAFE